MFDKTQAKILEIRGQIESLTEGRDSEKYVLARTQLTIRYDHSLVFKGRDMKENWQKLMEEIDILSDQIAAKSALFDMRLFMKSIDQFKKQCENCRRYESEEQRIEYKRLVSVIKDNLNLIVDINKQKDPEIPPDVTTAKNSLITCLKTLHKSTLNDIVFFIQDLDQFQKKCTNCRSSEDENNQSEYTRLEKEIRDKLDMIADIKKHNILEIPPEVINGRKQLYDCLHILNQQEE